MKLKRSGFRFGETQTQLNIKLEPHPRASLDGFPARRTFFGSIYILIFFCRFYGSSILCPKTFEHTSNILTHRLVTRFLLVGHNTYYILSLTPIDRFYRPSLMRFGRWTFISRIPMMCWMNLRNRDSCNKCCQMTVVYPRTPS